MRRGLMFFFVVVLLTMIVLTVRASLAENVIDALRRLWPDPWFQATLADTYFAFATLALWIGWRERWGLRGLAWVAAVFGLGNLAIAVYLLLSLTRRQDGESIEALMARRPP